MFVWYCHPILVNIFFKGRLQFTNRKINFKNDLDVLEYIYNTINTLFLFPIETILLYSLKETYMNIQELSIHFFFKHQSQISPIKKIEVDITLIYRFIDLLFRVKLNFVPKNSRTFYPELSRFTVSSIFQMTSRCR